jgi:uncharacterized protein (TIGR03086 family)
MTPTSDVAFLDGLDLFGTVVEAVPAGRWDAPTPCAGWNALDVLGHLGSSIDFGVSILEGREHAWPTVDRPAELVDGEPAPYWDRIADRARSALVGVDLEATRETPMGTRSVARSLAFPAIDCFVHAWDIGHAVGIAVELPEDAIVFTHHYLDPMPQDRMRGPGGAFGPELAPPAGASPTEALIAWTGRAPR